MSEIDEKDVKRYEREFLETLEHLEKQFSDGSPIGNKALRSKLREKSQVRWNDDKVYWNIKNRLAENGKLERRKGNGGSMRLVAPEAELKLIYKYDERELYHPACKVIVESWVEDQGLFTNKKGEVDPSKYFAEITAFGGRKYTGGKWSRPDITLVGYRYFKYIPGNYLDVVSFEVKKVEAADVDLVYEAVGHLRYVTHAYALIYVPESNLTAIQRRRIDDRIERIYDEAARHGVGLIVVSDVDDYDTWDTKLQAVRQAPDPFETDQFVEDQIDESNRNKVINWRNESFILIPTDK